jgi:DNA-binding Xre family transcriptional regulator
MTQEGLAERADISVDVVRKLEQHRKDDVRLETLRKLSAGLEMDPAVLLRDGGAPRSHGGGSGSRRGRADA